MMTLGLSPMPNGLGGSESAVKTFPSRTEAEAAPNISKDHQAVPPNSSAGLPRVAGHAERLGPDTNTPSRNDESTTDQRRMSTPSAPRLPALQRHQDCDAAIYNAAYLLGAVKRTRQQEESCNSPTTARLQNRRIRDDPSTACPSDQISLLRASPEPKTAHRELLLPVMLQPNATAEEKKVNRLYAKNRNLGLQWYYFTTRGSPFIVSTHSGSYQALPLIDMAGRNNELAWEHIRAPEQKAKGLDAGPYAGYTVTLSSRERRKAQLSSSLVLINPTLRANKVKKPAPLDDTEPDIEPLEGPKDSADGNNDDDDKQAGAELERGVAHNLLITSYNQFIDRPLNAEWQDNGSPHGLMQALKKYIPKVSEDAVGALVDEFAKGDANDHNTPNSDGRYFGLKEFSANLRPARGIIRRRPEAGRKRGLPEGRILSASSRARSDAIGQALNQERGYVFDLIDNACYAPQTRLKP
ncbi:KilA-N domain-containing protein [Colletotrichum plurivorum]|uniref:KilA-N domain-containing protein n=1 Tax=Colletotrichum plurivorum TaxID=2175906 RepID=A0A8H6NL36_9PEZI|nr:KilA-N domain-containing protein [Colletotrichum plurivorum]